MGDNCQHQNLAITIGINNLPKPGAVVVVVVPKPVVPVDAVPKEKLVVPNPVVAINKIKLMLQA